MYVCSACLVISDPIPPPRTTTRTTPMSKPDSSDFTAMINKLLEVIVLSISYFIRREKSRITLNYIGSISSFSNWKKIFFNDVLHQKFTWAFQTHLQLIQKNPNCQFGILKTNLFQRFDVTYNDHFKIVTT